MSLIIVEGPDGAGKSTLIQKLSEDLDLPIYSSGKPEGPMQLMSTMTTLVNMAKDLDITYLVDRYPAISEPIYSKVLNKKKYFTPDLIDFFLNQEIKVIWCNLRDRKQMFDNISTDYKPHKPLKHLQEVKENYYVLCEEYFDFMTKISDKVDIYQYDWTSDKYKKLKEWF